MARLLLQQDGKPVNEFPLSGERTHIGREQLNHIRLADPLISRFHAEIQRRGCCYTLVDRQSTNGTRLNGETLTAPATLADNDLVSFGDTTLVFRLDPGDSPVRLQPQSFNSNATLLDAGEALAGE